MRRRHFIEMLGGAAVFVLQVPIVHADEGLPLVGVLMPAADLGDQGLLLQTLITRLQQLGWRDGRTFRYEVRWGNVAAGVAAANAADLVRLGAKVIVTYSTPVTQAAHKTTQAVPIVFAGLTDPLASGLVASLAHPGGNVTGFSNVEFAMGAKWLELLKQVEPWAGRVLVLTDPKNDGNRGLLRAIEKAAPAMSVEVTAGDKADVPSLAGILKSFAEKPDGGLIIMPVAGPDALPVILGAAEKYRLPAVYPVAENARSGGLISYGIDQNELWRGAAGYVDRILKGEKPGDLPVQQASKFDLVINLKTAKAMGLTIPPELLVRADEVIE